MSLNALQFYFSLQALPCRASGGPVQLIWPAGCPLLFHKLFCIETKKQSNEGFYFFCVDLFICAHYDESSASQPPAGPTVHRAQTPPGRSGAPAGRDSKLPGRQPPDQGGLPADGRARLSPGRQSNREVSRKTMLWLLFAFGSAFFAGITAILAKIGIQNVNSTLATAIRTIVVLFFSWLMVFVAGSQSELWALSGHTLLFLVLSGLSTGASWLCYFRALQLGDVNKVAPIDKSSTVLTILLAFLFLGEPVSFPQIIGILGIGIGTLLMISKQEVEKNQPDSMQWLLFAVLSAVFASLTSIFGKIGVEQVESNLGTAIRTVVVLVMAWLMVFITGEQKGLRKISRKSWIFLFLSGITTGLSWLCYYRALQDGPASVVVPVDKLSILVTVVFSTLILKEKLGRRALIGLALILIGTGAMLL